MKSGSKAYPAGEKEWHRNSGSKKELLSSNEVHVPTSSSLVFGREFIILGGLAAPTNSSSLLSRSEEMMLT
jgi:hypothetical protein